MPVLALEMRLSILDMVWSQATYRLERTACNVESRSTGLILVRDSYCAKCAWTFLSKLFAYNCSAIPLNP